MEGHYHFYFDDPECDDGFAAVNEPDFAQALEDAKRTAQEMGPPSDVHFACTFGCGMPHALKAEEIAAVKAAFPDLGDEVFTGNG
jgi:hypothetical protein